VKTQLPSLPSGKLLKLARRAYDCADRARTPVAHARLTYLWSAALAVLANRSH
jgi:hypothetical protein